MGSSAGKPKSTFQTVNHGSEWALRLESLSLEGLFEALGDAISSQLGFHSQGPLGAIEHVELTARDVPSLLVEFANELLYRADTFGAAYSDFHVSLLEPKSLRVAMRRCLALESLRNPVKAATYHGLTVQPSTAGYFATLVLDV